MQEQIEFKLDELQTDIMDCIDANLMEVGKALRLPLRMDYSLLSMVIKHDLLRVYTARSATSGELMAYATFLREPQSLLLRGKSLVKELALYVLPPYRKSFLLVRLLKYSMADLRKQGVDMVVFASPVDLSAVMRRIGARPLEHAYGKEL